MHRRRLDLKMAEKEKKIIDAAIAIISEKGFSASSTSEIAQMAGVAEGTIFRYFKTKKDILRGILIHMVNMIGEPLILASFKKILYKEEPGRPTIRCTCFCQRTLCADRSDLSHAPYRDHRSDVP